MKVKEQQMLERITLNPKVMSGKPVIKGTRLTVEYVLGLFAHGATSAEILAEYEGLSAEDLQACCYSIQEKENHGGHGEHGGSEEFGRRSLPNVHGSFCHISSPCSPCPPWF